MIPPEAVRHKMQKDDVDAKIVEAVLGSAAEDVPIAEPSSAATEVVDGKKPKALTTEEETIAASYRRLLKLQIPKDAVRERMVTEGVSKKIISRVLGFSMPEPKQNVEEKE